MPTKRRLIKFREDRAVIIFLSLICALVGVLMYALSANAKLQEIGRISYFAGLLAFLLQIAPQMVSLIGK